MAKRTIQRQQTDRPEDTERKKLVEYCLDLYQEYGKSEYRDAEIKEIQASRMTYEQKSDKDPGPWPGASNEVLPFETITIDNLEPRLVAGLTGRDPIVAFGAEGEKDEEEEIIEDWFNKELKAAVKVEEMARNAVHTLLLEGTRYSAQEYDETEILRRDFIFDENTGLPQFDEKTGKPLFEDRPEIAFEGCKDIQIPFNKIFIPDDVGTPEEWEETDKIREVEYTYGDLMSKKDVYGWHNIGPWILPKSDKKKLAEKDKTPSQIVAGVDVTGKETIKCIECHISYPIKYIGKEETTTDEEWASYEEDRVIVTIAVDEKLCIRQLLQREINFNNESILKRIRLFAEEGRSYGKSIHGKMKAVQNGASSLFNRLLNLADICMLPWYFYQAGAGVRGDQVVKPGQGVQVEDISKIKFPEFFKINPQQYIEFFKLFIDLWERLVGLGMPQQGKQTTEGKTATEILTVVQEGNIKHNYQSKTFKEEFLSILRTIYDLYYHYMPYDKKIEYGGKQIMLPKQRMRRPKAFRLTGSTEQANKLIERKETEDFYNFTAQDPLFNPIKIREDLCKAYNREDVDSYIKPEIKQLIDIFMAAPDETMQAVAPVVQFLQEAEAAQMQQGKGGQQAA
ncbi:MAG: hypothetical protein ABIA66_03670 [Candidatus Omnitrophota bacterium]